MQLLHLQYTILLWEIFLKQGYLQFQEVLITQVGYTVKSHIKRAICYLQVGLLVTYLMK